MLNDFYLYLGIIGWLFVTGMGIVPMVPEEVAVSGVGIMAQQKQLNLFLAWITCIVGILGTDMVLFAVGVTGGKWLLARPLVRKLISLERQEKIISGFRDHGVKFLVSGRLLPGIRTAIFIVAGAIRYPFSRFLVADLVSIPVISFFFFGSVWAAESIAWLIANLHNAQNLVLLALIAALVVFAAWRYVQFIRRRSITNDFAAPHLPVIEQLLPNESKTVTKVAEGTPSTAEARP